MKNQNQSILIAAFSAVIVGGVLKLFFTELDFQFISEATSIVGQLFIKLLKMILIPLVFFSIITGVSSLENGQKSSRIWKITLIYFLLTMAIAITTSLIVMNFIKPGVGINIDTWKNIASQTSEILSISDFIKSFSLGLFENPFQSLASGNILPLIIFSLMIGVALNDKNGEMEVGKKFFKVFHEITLKIVNWIMKLSPIGIFSLLTNMILNQNLLLFSEIGSFILVVLFITLFHGIVILPSLLFIVTRISPKHLWREGKGAFITAFATSSSAATLPITLNIAKNNFKLDPSVSNFVLPIGATVNMDGTALYEAAAALFIANLVGMDISLSQQLVLFFMAMVASIGAPGIPSAGMVTMAMVLQVLGLPLEALAILLHIDRLLDTFRTTINVEGDLVGALVVNKLSQN